MGPLNRRILVVEDESTLRALFRRRAEHAGLHVLEAATSAQGIALAAIERPDLILIDLHLPDGSGIELIERLKADPRTARIPVIGWSGSDAEESEADVVRAGAAAYFEKTNLKGLIIKIVELTQPR
jgi:two-component system, cell cycle response regulator